MITPLHKGSGGSILCSLYSNNYSKVMNPNTTGLYITIGMAIVMLILVDYLHHKLQFLEFLN